MGSTDNILELFEEEQVHKHLDEIYWKIYAGCTFKARRSLTFRIFNIIINAKTSHKVFEVIFQVACLCERPLVHMIPSFLFNR